MKPKIGCITFTILFAAMASWMPLSYAAGDADNKSPTKTSKNIPKKVSKPKRASVAARVPSNCRIIRVKTAKGHRNKRVCSAADPLLSSPISENALSQPQRHAAAPEMKARSVPNRAYAVDGETFFYQGRKYRVQGVVPGSLAIGSEHAKQKLQMALDGGTVSVDPVSTDDNGISLAVVKVNGSNVVDLIGAAK